MNTAPIRRSQLVAPFGVGALHTTSDGVAMIACGLDYWYLNEDGTTDHVDLDDYRISEWRLQQILGVGQLRLPPDYREPYPYGQDKTNMRLSVPFLRFPKWHFCGRCRALLEIPATARGRVLCPPCEQQDDDASAGSPAGAGEAAESDYDIGGPELALPGGSKGRSARRRRTYLAQVPFIAICEQGHIQDFPWREWVHRDIRPRCNGRLRLVATGGASLAAQQVECDCGVEQRTLSGITEATTKADGTSTSTLSDSLSETDRYVCRGLRPWLGDDAGEGCGCAIRGSLRSATNVYYPHVESTIFIPRSIHRLDPKLMELLSEPPLSTWIKFAMDVRLEPTVEQIRGSENGQLLRPFDDDQIAKGLAAMAATQSTDGEPAGEQIPDSTLTKDYVRRPEYGHLRQGIDSHELSVRPVDPALYDSPVSSHFSRVNLAETLRETRALYGFSRVLPATERRYRDHRARLWKKEPAAYSHNWLPAYIVNGEGIYLELHEDRLAAWEERYRPRLSVLQHSDDEARARKGQQPRPIPGRYVLIHTLAHLLINRLIFDCGYASASLRERLYASADSSPMAGLLIYTAAGDSEGTMGGLVRMGKPGNLESVLAAALEEAHWCSADPVCMELGEQGQGPESCNLAACHACTLLPETACENFNRLLDRAAVVGTHMAPDVGYFRATPGE